MVLVIRIAGAIAAGAIVALLLAYAGAVLVMLATVGMPLGAQPRATPPAEYAVLLGVAALAAAAGARVAARIARSDASLAVLGLAGVLAATYWWGFTGTASAWPDWWAPSVAVAAALGAWAGTIGARRLDD